MAKSTVLKPFALARTRVRTQQPVVCTSRIIIIISSSSRASQNHAARRKETNALFHGMAQYRGARMIVKMRWEKEENTNGND